MRVFKWLSMAIDNKEVSLFLPAFPYAGGLIFVAIYDDFIMAVNILC
jgi:hypothetical protein